MRSCLARDSLFADHISAVHLSQTLSDLLSLLINGDDHLFSVGSELYASIVPYFCLLVCLSLCHDCISIFVYP